MVKIGSDNQTQNRLYRSEKNRIIAGVCSGLGEYFHIDPNLIRIVFVLLALMQGAGIIIYLLLWILVPEQSGKSIISQQSFKKNLDEIIDRTKTFAQNIHLNQPSNTPLRNDSKYYFAILLVILGFYFLLDNFGIFNNLNLSLYWPVILIILGLILILRK